MDQTCILKRSNKTTSSEMQQLTTTVGGLYDGFCGFMEKENRMTEVNKNNRRLTNIDRDFRDLHGLILLSFISSVYMD